MSTVCPRMEAALEGVLVLVFRCGSELTMGAASMTFQAARGGYLFEAVGAGKGGSMRHV